MTQVAIPKHADNRIVCDWLSPQSELPIVSVRSQPVVCKSNVDCNGDDLGVMSARECCVNNPEGLSFTDQATEMCTACIGQYSMNTLIEYEAISFDSFTVYGFFQDTFVGIEQGASHMLQVGYQKGGAQSLLFNVVTSPGTASIYVIYSLILHVGLAHNNYCTIKIYDIQWSGK